MSLFKECINALGSNAKIVGENTSNAILTQFGKDFPLTSWGRINWKCISNKGAILSLDRIIPEIKNKGKNPFNLVYIIGSDPNIPVLESKLDKILEFFDDVEAVSPNSWFYCPQERWVVEVYHDGEITLGFV